MQFKPIRRPQAGDTQISASMLNELISRVKRLETLHANSPIKLENTIAGMCLSLNTDIQTFRIAQAQENHAGSGGSSLCYITRYDHGPQTFVADEKQQIQVFDPFNEGFWAGQTIVVTRYYDSDIWVHIPVQGRYLYGITQAELEPCSVVSVNRYNGVGLLGLFYNAFNPHDWTAPAGVFIQAKWFPVAQTFSIYAVDCEASCLGLE